MDKKAKELHYKLADLGGATGDLQSILEAMLKRFHLPKDRLEMLGTNNDEGQVLLHERHCQSVLCLTMSCYTKGTLQLIMGMSPTKEIWPIEQVAPPKLAGATETEFLDGYLYLGVWKNHVIVLPTRSCNTEQLELHLNWLLRRYPHWPEKAVLALNDLPPRACRDKAFQEVQAFMLEAPLQARPVTHAGPGTSHGGQGTGTIRVTPFGVTWESIKNLLAQLGGKLPEDVLLDEAFDPNDLQIKVEVSCRKRALERSGTLLDVLANSLRHVTTEVVKVRFKDGTELKGSDLKIHKTIRLECSGNMPVPQQVDKAMYDYLQELIEGHIIK